MAKRPWSADELALLGAIHADPRDDAPRLVYADWLEEHSDPALAEFIRLCCRIESLSDGDSSRGELKQRADQLAEENCVRWVGELPDCLFFTGRFHGGLPCVTHRFAFRTLADLGALMRRAVTAASPRHHFALQVDMAPQARGSAAKSRWWFGNHETVMSPEVMGRVFHYSIAFGFRGRRGGLNCMNVRPACAILTDLSERIDERRTPWVTVLHASAAIREHARLLLADRLDLGFVDGRNAPRHLPPDRRGT